MNPVTAVPPHGVSSHNSTSRDIDAVAIVTFDDIAGDQRGICADDATVAVRGD